MIATVGRQRVTPSWRGTRAVALASIAWVSAGGSHLVAGGRLPGPGMALGLILLTAWPLVLATPGRCGPARLLGVTSAAQSLMHVLLVLTAPGVGATATGGAMHADTSGSGHTTGHAATVQFAATSSSSGSGELLTDHAMPLLPTPAMLLAHLVAALVLVGMLWAGERGVHRVLDLLEVVLTPLVRLGAQWRRALRAAVGASAPPARPVHAARSPRRTPG